MTDATVTDILVVGEGSAGQTVAQAVSEEGCDVILLRDGRSPGTEISTGSLTFAVREGVGRSQLFKAMSRVTGKSSCDRALLARLVDEARRQLCSHMDSSL